MKSKQIENIIKLTYIEVEKAIKEGNAPFAVIIIDKKGSIIVKAHNTVNSTKDATAHAEINALRKLSKKTGKIKFKNYICFINSEPCSMCASAIIRSGIREIYYGADQEDGQVLKIPLQVIAQKSKEKIKITKGILKEECSEQIQRGRRLLKNFK